MKLGEKEVEKEDGRGSENGGESEEMSR